MNKTFLVLAGISGLLAVALGAFGAHGLKPHLSTDELLWFETGNRYHFYHTFALLAVALLKNDSRLLRYAGFSFLIGILLFSGSLYIMAVTGVRALGMITPVGGIAFLAGWGMLVRFAIQKN